MERKPMRDTSLQIDLSKPIGLGSINIDHECFGLEFKIDAKECRACHLNQICQLMYRNQVVQKRIVKIREEHGPFLDQVDFDNVPWDKLTELSIANSGEYKIGDIANVVKAKSQCQDMRMVVAKIKQWVVENGFKVREGIIYVAEEYNDEEE